MTNRFERDFHELFLSIQKAEATRLEIQAGSAKVEQSLAKVADSLKDRRKDG